MVGEDDPEVVAVEDRLEIEQLEPRERHIVYLRFYEGLTQSEIAERRSSAAPPEGEARLRR